MKSKGLLFAGLAIAGLLALSPDAQAGFRVGYRGGPRHEVIVARPGWFSFAGHRAWYGPRYAWTPGGWYFRHPLYHRPYGPWRFRRGGRAFYGRGGFRR